MLRSCLEVPTSRPHSQNVTALGSSGSPSLSTESLPRQCPVPGTWLADEVLSAAKWIFGNPGLDWVTDSWCRRSQTNQDQVCYHQSLEFRGRQCSREGRPAGVRQNPFHSPFFCPPLPPLPTPPGSPAPDVANVTLPLPTPLTLPPTAGSLLPRLPSLVPSSGPGAPIESLLFSLSSSLGFVLCVYYISIGSFSCLLSCFREASLCQEI